MSITGLIAVAAGGAVGAVARYLVYATIGHLPATGFPYATLAVNVVGSFAMGALVETMALAWNGSLTMRLFLATGVLGSFTTFSTFSLDFVVLFERRAWIACALYAFGSVVLSIGALIAGLALVRRMLAPTV